MSKAMQMVQRIHESGAGSGVTHDAIDRAVRSGSERDAVKALIMARDDRLSGWVVDRANEGLGFRGKDW
jgi:hypothetical protein